MGSRCSNVRMDQDAPCWQPSVHSSPRPTPMPLRIPLHCPSPPPVPAALGGKMKIEALAALDHAAVEYADFAKDFYEEAPEIFAMDDREASPESR